MFQQDQSKQKRLKNILSIMKLAILFFCVIIIFQTFFSSTSWVNLFAIDTIYMLAVIGIFPALYFFWSLVVSIRKPFDKAKGYVEYGALFVVSCVQVLMSGGYASSIKFIFIFVILVATIEFEMKYGLILSGLSAAFLFYLDLFTVPAEVNNLFFENDLLLVVAFLLITYALGYYVKNESAHIEMLYKMASLDSLTGLPNHRNFYEGLEAAVAKAQQEDASVALIFIDLDDFKIYNDLFGHQRGDEVLKHIAGILENIVSDDVLAARYGGEEYAVLIYGRGNQEVFSIAERIRGEIYNAPFEGQEYMPNENLTASLGVALYPEQAKDISGLVKSADEALYKAKFLTKNSVVVYSDALKEVTGGLQNGSESDILASIRTLNAVINSRDKYTYCHVERVVTYCTGFSKFIHMSEADAKALITAAYLHDVGKINIPQEVLMKTGAITPQEREQLRSHAGKGADIIREIPCFASVTPIVYQHHERYDGGGYPQGLKSFQIHYLARVLTVIDSFDAMTSIRPYQKRRTFEEGCEEIARCSGTQFDPEIAEQFIAYVQAELIAKEQENIPLEGFIS